MIYNNFTNGLERDKVHALAERIRTVLDDNFMYVKLFEDTQVMRLHKDNVNPFGTAVWYARNEQGKRVILGNKVFFKGKANVKNVVGKPYTTDDLIMHELCHNINYRVDVSPIAKYYADRSMFGFVAASSTHPAETITDAFANYFMGTLSDVWLMKRLILPYVKESLQ